MIDVVNILKQLVRIESFSKNENDTADLLASVLESLGHPVMRVGNNVVAWHRSEREDAPVVVLNSHHDTVKPSQAWTKNPFEPVEIDGKLFGLGSNDAGGALVTMLAAFVELSKLDLPCHICFAATAEEEISGLNGMEMLVRENVFGKTPVLVLVGEPTGMNLSVSEKGLIVLDCTARGVTGHAARNEGDNAIHHAIQDINWLSTHQFERVSDTLGSIKMTVTQIHAGSQHNVVPDECTFVVDVRVTDAYTHEEVLDVIKSHVRSDVSARSMRLRPSSLPVDHAMHAIARDMGVHTYGSPTMSDQSLLPSHWPSAKIGPGDSARSHTADEYIYIQELVEAPSVLVRLLLAYIDTL